MIVKPQSCNSHDTKKKSSPLKIGLIAGALFASALNGCGGNESVAPGLSASATPTSKPKDPRASEKDAAPPGPPRAPSLMSENPDVELIPVSQKSERDLASLVTAIEPAVIRIDVDTDDGKAIGSGFIVGADGIAVTNFHVIEGAKHATATFRNDAKLEVTGVLGVNKELDIAILKINSPGKTEFISLAMSPPRKGESVVAFGAPKGLSFSVTDGIVSAVRPGSELVEFGGSGKGTWIQTSAPISSGNSGGPLVNNSGNVIGMNTLVFKNAQNVNFAISATDIQQILNSSKGQASVPFSDSKSLARITASTTDSESKGVPGHDSEPSPKSAEFVNRIKAERDARLKECAEAEIAIENAKRDLRVAMLAGDATKESDKRRQIKSQRQKIALILDRPFSLGILKLNELTTGSIGILDGTRVEIIQVVDKKRGECIVLPFLAQDSNGRALWLRGVDLSSTVDGDVISLSEQVLEVAGTKTYSTKNSSNTVFVLQVIPGVRELITAMRTGYKTRAINDEPNLSPDEQKQIAQRKEAETLKTKSEQDEKAAAGKLRAADLWLKAGKDAEYRRTLKECIDKYPDTKAAEKARRVLGIKKKAAVEPATPPAQSLEVLPKEAAPFEPDTLKKSDVFLSDLNETDAEFWEYVPGFGFGKNGQLPEGKDKVGKIVLAGKESPKGIFAHPKSRGLSKVTYDLGDSNYEFFSAEVGVADERKYGPASPVTFEVWGDGKMLWQSEPVKMWGQAQKCKVRIADVKRLELRVNCPGDAAFAYAVWCEPKLTNEK